MTFGSLFAGIGGIDLGLERAGMECKWQVEIDPRCRQVLAKHWPNVRRYEDVTKAHGLLAHAENQGIVRGIGEPTNDGSEGAEWRIIEGRGRTNDGNSGSICHTASAGSQNRNGCTECLEPVDLIAGGFPCQDVSVAGQRAGIQDGTRSGLWSEFHRIICELRPRYVFVENVPGLLANGMGRVLGDLAESGYDAEWEVLSAADVGAPHLRKRVFITAYNRISDASGDELRVVRERGGREHTISPSSISGNDGEEEQVADANCSTGRVYRRSDSGRENLEGYAGCSGTAYGQQRENWWTTEPDVGRVAHGVPSRLHRLKVLGNAVVPQCAEYVGRRIMESQTGLAI